MKLKKFFSLILFFVLAFSLAFPARADENTILLESYVSDQSAVLYTRSTASPVTQARIAFENIDGFSVDGQDGSLPMTTWLLMDNSLSIQQADRLRAKQLLADIVSSRSANEVFTLCTMTEHLNPILTECGDYSELKRAIDGIQHFNQLTSLTDCLDDLLSTEAARSDVRYVRVVVIADGFDNNPSGITRDELVAKLAKKNIPIYSVGCAGKTEELKEMYALSRQTGAAYWALSEAENYDITHALSSDELPIRITIPIPASACDGTTKGVQLTFEDGSELQTQMDMPFGAIIEPSPTVEPEPEPEPVVVPIPLPPEPEPEPVPEPTPADWMREHWLLIVLLALLLAALAVGGYLLLSRKKPPKPKELIPTPPPQRNIAPPPPADMPPSRITLGRAEDCDVSIDDTKVSKRHCAIAVAGNNITVYDLGSLNGTWIDGVRLDKNGSGPARSGSTLTLASVDLMLEICADAALDGASPAFGGETIYMDTISTGAESSGSAKTFLCITDMRTGSCCCKLPLPDCTDATVYMG